MFSISLDLN